MAISIIPQEFLPATLVLLATLFLFRCILKMKRNKLEGYKFPPSPPKLPVIGNLHQLGKLPHHSLWILSRKYGPVMQLQLGSIPALVVSSPEMAKQVLKEHDLEMCSRPISPGSRKISYNNSDVTFSPYNEHWKEMRKLLTLELLSMKRVHSFQHIRGAEVDNLMDILTQNSKKLVNLNEMIFSLLDGIVGNMAFDKLCGKERFGDKGLPRLLSDVMRMLAIFSAEDFFPKWGHIIDNMTGQSARLEKNFNDLDRYFQHLLDEHRKPSKPNESLVAFLLSLQRNPKSSLNLTDDQIKAILLDTFVGGINTSAVTIIWSMAELIRNPRVMNKVQEEIRSLVGKKPKVEEDDLAKLKYLKNIVKETLRLHPPATLLIPRETMQYCKIGGYDVLPKTRVFVNAWGIGRDPKVWDNAEKFNPDRFEENGIDFKGQHFEVLLFGGGRRICPGLAMGATSVEYTLANLLYGFDWKVPNGMKIQDVSLEEERGGLITQKKEPLRLVPIKCDWHD